MNYFDKSWALLNTYKCDNVKIIFDENNSVVLQHNNPKNKDFIFLENSIIYDKDVFNKKEYIFIPKKEMFVKVFNLGKFINDNIENITISELFLNSDEIENDIFNICDKILNNDLIKEKIENFFIEYGIPELFGKEKEFNYKQYKQDIIENTSININELSKRNSNGKTLVVSRGSSNELLYLNMFKQDLDKNFEENNTFNILPYINLSLIIYYIYNIKDVIANVKTRHLYKAIKFSTYLEHQYLIKCYVDKEIDETDLKTGKNITKKVFKYDNDFIRVVNEYTKKLIAKTNDYTQNTFYIINSEKILFADSQLPNSKKNINPYTFDFYKTIYVMSNPFLTAYEYMLNILPAHQKIPPIFFCDNCHQVLGKKELLCSVCKDDLYTLYIDKYSNSNSESKQKLLKSITEEYNNWKKHSDSTTIIENLYKDKRNHEKYDNSIKGKKYKRDYYKRMSNK